MKKSLLLLPLLLGSFCGDIQVAQANGKIADGVLKPYNKKTYPKTFKKYRGRMNDLQKYRVLAAKKAASKRECAEVVMAEISDSSTRDSMNFFVYCSPRPGLSKLKKYYFSESDLKNSGSIENSEEDKALSKDEVEVLKVCEDLIVEKMKNQSTLKINAVDSVINIYQTGQVHAQINFTSGEATKYRAICRFKLGEPNGSISIRQRYYGD